MKILFQGDSITDAGRDKTDPHNLSGYSLIVAETLKRKYPEKDFEFINLGISGNRSCDLVARYESDFKTIAPDITAIMIGINDVWHYYADTLKYVSPESYENNYGFILKNLKRDTNTKIIMMEPYLLPAPSFVHMRMDLYSIIERGRRLAETFADEYIPFDGLFAQACVHNPWQVLSNDGVHPALKGQQLIAEYLVKAIENQMR